MRHTHKKSGRPPDTKKSRSEKLAQRRNEGDRLRQALQRLDLSQKSAELKSGIRQGHITEMISGVRRIGRDDLSAFAEKLGISADFILGSDVPVAWRERSAIGALADEFHALVCRHAGIAEAQTLAADLRVEPIVGPKDVLLAAAPQLLADGVLRARCRLMSRRLEALSELVRRDALRSRGLEEAARQRMYDEGGFIGDVARRVEADPQGFFSATSGHVYARKFASPLPTLIALEAGGPLFNESIWTPFRVPYGYGWIHQGRHDEAWYVDPVSGAPTHIVGTFLELLAGDEDGFLPGEEPLDRARRLLPVHHALTGARRGATLRSGSKDGKASRSS